MATHKSAEKRARQNVKRRKRNRAYKTRTKTAIKQVQSALDRKAPSEAQEHLNQAISILQKASSKGIIHRNKADRNVSRLTRKVQQLSS